jgi:hypothetical protein
MEKVYENLLVDLRAEENVPSGLSIILDRMANSSGKYNVSEFLHPDSDQWLYMENIEALFSFVAKTSIKMPMNLDRSLMELIGSNSNLPIENFKQKDMDEIHNIFSLPDNELNLITICTL